LFWAGPRPKVEVFVMHRAMRQRMPGRRFAAGKYFEGKSNKSMKKQ